MSRAEPRRQRSPQTDASRSQYGQARAMHSAFARQIATSVTRACPHRAAQAAVAAGIHKPQSMRQAPRQITDSVTKACPPSNRTGSGRRRHSQAAVNATSVRNAQRICSANCDQRSDGVPPSSRAGIHKPYPVRQAFAMHSAFARQIADSAAMARPHRAAQAAVAAGIHKPQSMQQARVVTICLPDRDQRSDGVPPSSRAGSGRRRHSQAASNAGRRSQCSVFARQIADSVTQAGA